MKLILKVIAFPIMLILTMLIMICNVITNFSSYVIGLFLLFIGVCSIYSLIRKEWLNLAILIGIGLTVFLGLFFLVFVIVHLELCRDGLRKFIRS